MKKNSNITFLIFLQTCAYPIYHPIPPIQARESGIDFEKKMNIKNRIVFIYSLSARCAAWISAYAQCHKIHN